MTVFKVVGGDRTFFVATVDADMARVVVLANHPEIDPAGITVTEEPTPTDEDRGAP